MQRPDCFPRAHQLHAIRRLRATRWLLGYDALGEIPPLILSNGGGARRILKSGMAYQLLLDVALIIVAMGALHRFEARRVRSAHAPRTPRARPVPNPWRKAT